MKRHCPRCGKPAAIVVTSKQHATRIGEVTEEEWRCEECFKHFKLHSPLYQAFWLVAGILFLAFAVAVSAGFRVDPDQRVPVAVLLFAMGGAAAGYGAYALRLRSKAPVVTERAADPPD